MIQPAHFPAMVNGFIPGKVKRHRLAGNFLNPVAFSKGLVKNKFPEIARENQNTVGLKTGHRQIDQCGMIPLNIKNPLLFPGIGKGWW
ncbi:MAG: hypothetical protein EHM37_06605, partial [Deltaproteobacteria bacterium]